MAFHVAGWAENIDPAGAFADIAALADQRLFTAGNNLRGPSLNQIVAIAAGVESTAGNRARLYSPTIEQMARYEIAPLNLAGAGAVEPASPHAVVDLRRSPLLVGVDENIRAEILSNPAAAQDQWVLGWFADGPIAPVEPSGEFTVRATGTQAVAALAWTACNLTLDDELPPGNYAVVGMRFESATAIAGRLNFLGGEQSFRPGVLGVDAASDIEHPMFRHGGLGLFGTFPFTQLPQLEALCADADAAQTVYLDLVKVG